MSEPTSTYGVASRLLADLLALGASEEGSRRLSAAEARETLLRYWLMGTLPLDSEIMKRLSILAGQLCEALPFRGRAIGDVLLDESTPLEAFERIKEYHKAAAAETSSDVEHDVAGAVYFTAVAGALLAHGRKISTYTYAELGEYFGLLAEKPWMDPRLARLFTRARRLCRGRTEG